MKYGIQVSSLKPLLLTKEQVQLAFEKIAALGCPSVQIQWIDKGVEIRDIAGACQASGLENVGIQDFYELVTADLEYYVNLNAATGGIWVAVSRIPDRCKSPEGLDVFLRELRDLEKTLAKYGQKLCFHPVSADFQAVPGMNAVEYLLEKLPEMALCLDLYHLNRCCEDMPGFIRRYAGRIPMVHFKDSDENGKLVPAGQGTVRWEGVMEACEAAGVIWGFAEQETWEGDPYEALSQALAWMNGKWKVENGK